MLTGTHREAGQVIPRPRRLDHPTDWAGGIEGVDYLL